MGGCGVQKRLIFLSSKIESRPNDLQQAFIDKQVPQCGWCMSGQIMTAIAFLDENPAPNREEIVEAMGQNYCRCGCYVRIFNAVEKAAQESSVLTMRESTA